ncbi:hypothetical protein ACP4OV_019104 [Aristida adscensionis]
MANTERASGPVPFKDLDDGAAPEHNPKEDITDLVSALPRREVSSRELLLYQGFWLIAYEVPGAVAFQRRFVPRPDDVLLASYPKCGTTWLKALAFAVMARGTHPPSAPDHPLRRLNPHDCVPRIEVVFTTGKEAKHEQLPSPRLMNTHLPHTLLPETVTAGGCKIVYVCRDPRDTVVSMWHFFRPLVDLSFADMFETVCAGTVVNGPIWDHVLSYWRASITRPDRVLFLKYEDLLRDPGAGVRRLAEFIGLPFSAAEEDAGAVASIVELCSFDKMAGLEVNKSGTVDRAYISYARDSFFRKGVAGDWVNHLTPEMAARLEQIFRDKFKGTGLDFP